MGALFEDPVAVWAAVLILALPVLIIATGEVQEQLRQRGSTLVRPVATLRNWVLPAGAIYALLILVLDVSRDNFGVQMVGTALVIAIGAATLQTVQYFVHRTRERARLPGTRHVPQLLLMLPRIVVLLVAGWLLFQVVWNVDLGGLFAALGVTSIVISVALQDTLSGLASGFLLLSDRPFNPGDWIRVDDIEGRVLDMNWRSSRIENRNGDLLVIPNSALSGATITNYAEPARLHRVVVPVQVAYSNPPTAAKEMLLAAARATEGVLANPPPKIRVVQIDDPLMGYEADLWIDDFTIAPRVFSDFGSLIWYHSHRMGVPLPSPAYDIYHHDPIQEAIEAEVTPGQMLERIRRSPLLADLNEIDLQQLVDSARAVTFSRGEAILPPGVVDRDMYVMWRGRARIFIVEDPAMYVEIGDGDVFGILGSPGEDRSPPAVQAMTDCEVVVIDAESAGVVTSRNPSLTDAINQTTAARLKRLSATPGEYALGLAIPGAGDAVGEGEDADGTAGEGS